MISLMCFQLYLVIVIDLYEFLNVVNHCKAYLGSYLGPCGAAGRFRGILGTHRGKSRCEMIIRDVAR